MSSVESGHVLHDDDDLYDAGSNIVENWELSNQDEMEVLKKRQNEMAERARTRLARCNNDDMKDQIIETVQAKGYWSIWMTVFEDDPDMLQRLINAFPGTSQQCFCPQLKPVARNGGQ